MKIWIFTEIPAISLVDFTNLIASLKVYVTQDTFSEDGPNSILHKPSMETVDWFYRQTFLYDFVEL